MNILRTIISQRAKTIGLTSFRQQSDPIMLDRCLIDVDPRVFYIRVLQILNKWSDHLHFNIIDSGFNVDIQKQRSSYNYSNKSFHKPLKKNSSIFYFDKLCMFWAPSLTCKNWFWFFVIWLGEQLHFPAWLQLESLAGALHQACHPKWCNELMA